jgi:hypothetical protein
MEIQEVTGSDLPDTASHGFKVLDDDGNTLVFYHWHEEPEYTEGVVAGHDEDGNKVIVKRTNTRTSYQSVLESMEQRFHELDIDPDEAVALTGEVVGRFGAGQ